MNSVSTATQPPRTATARLALLACLGVVVYVLIDVLLAVLRPDLSLLHRAESDYGVGPYAWLMDVNFLLRGALSLLLAGALLSVRGQSGWLRGGAALLAAWGIGSGLLAFFPDNPPGTPATTSGQIHLILALVAFLCVAVGTIVLSGAVRHLAVLRGISAPLLVIALVALVPLLLLGHTQLRANSLDGLYERAFLGLELLWILLLGARLAQGARADPRPA
ncbi:MAG: DUF998 domain-containing protein [Candidatus Dormibacteria bacterium]